ncbi:MAG: outer membrane protein assembly factor BamD [Acidobacteriia bacterium]|nr:outer membrane protein assembly factor BamD [Terriglobia bacterium]
MMLRSLIRYGAASAALVFLMTSCGLRRHPYENPISKDTQQPDKVLFDKAIHDIEHSRYEIGRLTLQTLINTYDSSEYLAKAKLAIADSWYREGGARGLAQAEAEYKDFILFYPTMEEAAEAQEKVCDIQINQMEKPDRDPMHARRAEDECRQLLEQFPNSKFAPEAQQKLRNIQEVLAASEFKVGTFYHTKGSYPASANRLQALPDQYPLFSQNDEALWTMADDYHRMGDRFEAREAEAYTRIVRDFPLSGHVSAAKERLQALNRPVPDADPTALARMKSELENRERAGIPGRVFGVFSSKPDMRAAAKSGTPTMAGLRPTTPVSVPGALTGAAGTTSDVSAQVLSDTSALDKGQDARALPPGQTAAAAQTGDSGQAAVAQTQPLPTNHTAPPKKQKKVKKAKAPKVDPQPKGAAQPTPDAPPKADTQP